MAEVQNDTTALSNPYAEISMEYMGVKKGLITFASLVIYFLLMIYFSLMNSPIAWGVNLIILWMGIFLAYRNYRSKTKLNVDYIPGLLLGGITTAASVIPFVFFVYIYFSQADALQIGSLKNNIFFMGEPMTPLRVAGSTMIEGLCSGVIITFIMMQYFRSGFRKEYREKSMHG